MQEINIEGGEGNAGTFNYWASSIWICAGHGRDQFDLFAF